jgi:D-serine deaminase-like pyridoxal phosphate-dependent protein
MGIALDLAEAGAVRIGAGTTGFPAGVELAVAEVAGSGWTVFDDLVPPVVVLSESALEHNLQLMAGYCREHGVDLAPHGKTTMAPQLWARQLDAGAWAITAATPVQARVMRSVGVPRIVLADQLVDAGSIAWVARELADPSFDFVCWVDSARGVELLGAGLDAAGAPRPLAVAVELGHSGGRAGCRTVEEALDVAGLVADTSELVLAGVAGYEGTVCGERDSGCLAAIDGFLGELRRLTLELLHRGAFEAAGEVFVSAGGSAFFDRVVEVLGQTWPGEAGVRVVLRSGCYLTHDHGVYERNSPLAEAPVGQRFRPAFEAWGVVLSRPERDVAVVGLGKRDVPSDIDLPRPLRVRRHDGTLGEAPAMQVQRLMDQHAICTLDGADPLSVGDLVSFGVSHPCTAFDRRRVIPVVDDEGRVVEAIATMF